MHTGIYHMFDFCGMIQLKTLVIGKQRTAMRDKYNRNIYEKHLK